MKTFTFHAVILIVSFFAGVRSEAGEAYKFDAAHSMIGFKVHQFFNVTSGTFSRFSGTIDVDRDHPQESSVVARIEVASIDTGIKKRDDHLRSAEFFNIEKYPEISFKSRNVKQTGPQSGDVTGDFTMHGVTRVIVLHAQLVGETSAGPSHWRVTTEPIKRRDFGLAFSGTTESISGIAQEVAINIDIQAVRSK